RNAAEMANEIEAAAAETALMQLAKPALRDGVVDIGNRAIGPVALRDGIERNGVVGAVHAGIDDDGALDPELGVRRPKILKRRVRRRVGTIRRVGVFRAGTEDVAMRVAGKRRQLELWRARVRIGRRNGWRVHDSSQVNLNRRAGLSTSSFCWI